MPAEIAVFVDREGNTTKLTDRGKIVVFVRKRGKWHIAREKEFTLKQIHGMIDFRLKMEELLDFLGDCKVFVGFAISGIPYFILDKAKCSIWEWEGKPFEFLDYILQKEEESYLQKQATPKADISKNKDNMKSKDIQKPCFVEITPGNYSIFLKEIQESSTQVTTKQVLLPFIRRGKFNSIEMVCNHLPKWLEGEATLNSLMLKVSELEANKVKVMISKEQAHGS
ncbi:Fe-only nitrogenase accessory AnfO family protein [Syntrophobotulus glycolicus]|nr:Fe-only nitrogenase accessory AnfO family protein [Syntrophobotulus glycolicus]